MRAFTEGLARKTSRRSMFGRGAGLAAGALLGAAAGTLTKSGPAKAGIATLCIFPGPPCPCDACRTTGTCAKPCIFNQTFYASGCWVTAGVTCCDCDCLGYQNYDSCGCGSDYHNNPVFCPGK
jgi:hypothetical protein